MVFDPTGNAFGSVTGAQKQTVGVFAYGGGADLPIFNHVSLRAEYRDAFEKKHKGVRLGFMSVFVRACCSALKEFPAVNAEIDGDDVVYKNFVHMGIAVGGPSGGINT